MATRTGIAFELDLQHIWRLQERRATGAYPKPGMSRNFFFSLLMCFPVSCLMWAGIIYGAIKLAQ